MLDRLAQLDVRLAGHAILGREQDRAGLAEDLVGLVSVLAPTADREEVEVWLIGREGLVGLPAILGGASLCFRRVVQVGGSALRIPAGALRAACEQSPSLHRRLLPYADAVLVQAAQSGACAARHSLDQRVARWLMQARYSLGTDELPLTHALLARLVGVRRASVTVAVGRLEASGVVSQRWSCIAVADPGRLELAACDCHRLIRARRDAAHVPARPLGYEAAG
ncbi:MAG TPA: Crp/Fnr family transcriptional regulator [Falsiroseomonas sp.]|nr:Crp/Fnr family transcriptional regulator [Falsiroseomonas sp.]